MDTGEGVGTRGGKDSGGNVGENSGEGSGELVSSSLGMQGQGRSRGKGHCNEREGLKSEGEGSVQAFKGPLFKESVPVPAS